MAASRTIEILLQIKQTGDEVIKNLTKSLEELQKAAGEVQFAAVEKVGEKISGIGESVEEIAETITETVQSVASQSVDIAGSTVGRIQKNVEKSFETVAAKIAVILGSTIAFFSPAVFAVFLTGLGTFSAGLGVIATISDTLTATWVLLGAQAEFVFSIWEKTSLLFTNLFVSVGILNKTFLATTTVLGQIVATATGLLIIKTVFSESLFLLRRLVGRGSEALTPIERATRLITEIDQGINQIGVTGGQVLKVFSLGILSIVNPLLGIFPFINSSLSFILNAGKRLRLSAFEFFGSARARFLKILLDAQEVLSGILGDFRGLRKDATLAGKAIKKGIGDPKTFEAFQGLTRAKLPFAAQFQLALVEFRKLISEVVLQLNKITQTLQGVFGLSKEEIRGIDNKAKQALGGIQKNVEGVTQSFLSGPKSLVKSLIKQFTTLPTLDKLLGRRGTKAETLRPPIDPRKTVELQKRTTVFQSQQQLLKLINTQLAEVTRLIRELPAALNKVTQSLGGVQAKAKDAAFATGEIGKKGGVATLKKTGVETFAALKVAVTGSATAVKETAVKALSLSQAQGKVSLQTRNLVQTFGRYADSLAGGAKSSIAFEKAILSILTVLTRLGKEFQTLGKESGKKLSDAFAGGFKIDKSKFQPAFDKIKKTLDDLVKQGKIKGKDFGGQLVSLIAKGIGSKDSEIIKATEEVAALIASFFPQSPAKRGPLKALVKMGPAIVRTIASGMLKSIGFVVKAAGRVAGAILSPFTNLFQGFDLSQILDFKKVVKESAELKLVSQRVNISVELLRALGFAATEAGATVQDLTLTLTRAGRAISEGVADPKKRKAFADIGIDIEAISKKGKPTLALMLEISRVVQEGGENARKAIRLFGAFETGKIVNFLRLGPEAIVTAMNKAITSGVAFDSGFSKTALKLIALFSRFKQVIDSITRDFLGAVLPEILRIGKEVFDLIERNRVEIAVFFTATGQAVGRLIEGVKELVKFAIEKPGKSLGLLERVLKSLFNLAIKIVDEVILVTGKRILIFVVAVVPGLLKILVSAVKNFGGVFLNEIIKGLGLGIVFIIAFLKSTFVDGFDLLFVVVFRTAIKFVADIISGIFEFIVKSGLPKLLKKVGLGKVADELTKISKGFVEASEDAARNLEETNFGTVVEKSTKKASAAVKDFLGTKPFETIEKKAKKAAATFQKESKATIKSVVTLAKQGQKEILDPQIFQDFKNAFSAFVNDLKGIAGETPLKSLGADVQAVFSGLNFGIIRSEIEDTTGALKKAFEGITKAAKNAGRDTGDSLRKTITTIITFSNSVVGTVKSIFDGLVDLNKGQSKALIIAQKAAAIAQIQIAAAVGIMNAFKNVSSTAELVRAGIQSGFIAALASVQTAKVLTAAGGFQDGGMIEGKKGGRDNLLIKAESDEFVQPRTAVSHYGADVMEAIRQRMIPKGLLQSLAGFRPGASFPRPKLGFQTGGMITQGAAQAASAGAGGQGASGEGKEERVTNIMNIVDPSLVPSALAQQAGQEAVLNVISANAFRVRRILST